MWYLPSRLAFCQRSQSSGIHQFLLSGDPQSSCRKLSGYFQTHSLNVPTAPSQVSFAHSSKFLLKSFATSANSFAVSVNSFAADSDNSFPFSSNHFAASALYSDSNCLASSNTALEKLSGSLKNSSFPALLNASKTIF